MLQENREQLTRDGQMEGAMPMRVCLLALAPAEGRTPWWARGLRFSHLVVVVGDVVWDQPIRGKGAAYDLNSWIDSAGREREYVAITVEVRNHSPLRWREACKAVEGKKGQPLRTLLRHLGMWRWVPWNCTSPVRVLLGALDIQVTGETPDAILTELAHPADHGVHQSIAD